MKRWTHAVAAVCLLATAVAPLLVQARGAMVKYVEARNDDNPPPSVALKAYDRFELVPIAMDAPYAGQKSNEIARERLQANVDLRVPPILSEWNARPAATAAPRTLKIEPHIRHIRFISGGKRFFGGALAGGSAILVTVKLSDAGSGEVVAEPEFYQHANAWGAAYSFGGTDNAMNVRVSEMIATYLTANRDQAVGGPTGKREPDEEAPAEASKAEPAGA
ncbi:hypothetical protein [Lysobacter sp. CA196]|uniref:hypothetical protein n=1 Tax=Lysobacter sp. CA196 TaxID=3455606 RepID=UPI003F8D133F